MPARTDQLRRYVTAAVKRRRDGARALRERIERHRAAITRIPDHRTRGGRFAPFMLRRGWGW